MEDKQNKNKKNKPQKNQRIRSCCTHTKKDKNVLGQKIKKFLIYQGK